MKQIAELFLKVKEKGYPLSRLHIHPYGSFFICYDPKKWGDAYEAIIKSAITTPKFCLSGASYSDRPQYTSSQIHNFLIPDMPSEITHPTFPGQKIKTDKSSLTY